MNNSVSSSLIVDFLPSDRGQRLDKVLSSHVDALSRSRVQALIRDGQVCVDGLCVSDPDLRLADHLRASIRVPAAAPALPLPEPMSLNVLYEDDHLIVIDKPAGLVVHPGAGNPSGTLVNALLAHCGDSLSGIGGVARPGIVHRLDKDTSGVLVVAKHDTVHRHLSAQFADHGRTGPLERRYLALVWGGPDFPSGTVNAPLDRSRSDHEKQVVRASGREAITHWRVLERFSKGDRPIASLLECHLETGRTHQIRVHLAHIRHPVMGDPLYGRSHDSKSALLPGSAAEALKNLRRQALHAEFLGFVHPVLDSFMTFSAPLPADFAALLEALRAHDCS